MTNRSTTPTGTNAAAEGPSRRVIDNTDRVQVGFTRQRRNSQTTWGALAAGGGRIVRTTAGTVEVVATVGELADQVAKIVTSIDHSPATFLHSLAVAAAGHPLDIPRLVRALLAGRQPDVPDHVADAVTTCATARTLSTLGQLLAGTKPGAAQAVVDVVTASLDPFGPHLVPVHVKYYPDGHDHHAYSLDIEASMALAALYEGDVSDLADDMEDIGSATLTSAAVATLADWDRTFGAAMDDADWETVEAIHDQLTVQVLRATVAREFPGT